VLHQKNRYFFSFDWISFALTLALTLIGLLFVYSSTTTVGVPYSIYFKKQVLGIATGLVIYLFFCFKDYRALCRFGYFAFFTVMLLLVYTLIKGKIGMGAQRWIDIKIFRFQPSEITKLFFPAFFTYFLYTENDVPVYKFSNFIPLLGTLFLSSLLILKQPDLGTAIVFFSSGLCMLWLAGIGKTFFRIFILCCIIGAPLGWYFLKPYQKQRILVFTGAGDARKERYQIEQSIIAIGSGGIFGKGFTQGTQNQLLFLPESRTDLIFSVLCEEWGFIGALLLLTVYCMLFLRILYRILYVPTFFAQLLALGLLLPISISAGINVAMVCGLLPIVGVPLPLISYGITSLWMTFASLGWIQGITRKTV